MYGSCYPGIQVRISDEETVWIDDATDIPKLQIQVENEESHITPDHQTAPSSRDQNYIDGRLTMLERLQEEVRREDTMAKFIPMDPNDTGHHFEDGLRQIECPPRCDNIEPRDVFEDCFSRPDGALRVEDCEKKLAIEQ